MFVYIKRERHGVAILKIAISRLIFVRFISNLVHFSKIIFWTRWMSSIAASWRRQCLAAYGPAFIKIAISRQIFVRFSWNLVHLSKILCWTPFRAVRGPSCQISWSCDYKPLRYRDIGDFWKSKMAAKKYWKSKFHLDVAHLDTLAVLHVKFRNHATSNFGY